MLHGFGIIFLLSGAICALSDFLTFKIPNQILLFLIVLFIIYAALFLPIQEIYNHLIPAGVALIIGFILYAAKVIGAGDAKFITVCMLWITPSNIPTFILVTAIAGAVLALIYLFLENHIIKLKESCLKKIEAYSWGKSYLQDRITPPKLGADRIGKGLIPYGVAVFAGILFTSILTKGNF